MGESRQPRSAEPAMAGRRARVGSRMCTPAGVICGLILLAVGAGQNLSIAETATAHTVKASQGVISVTDPILFGARARPRGNQTLQEALVALENSSGRQFNVDRVFKRWDQRFPAHYDTWTRDEGRAIFLSVRARRVGGYRIPWRDIANAKPGTVLYSEMVAWARNLRTFGSHVYLAFHHEPDLTEDQPNGTPADFVAAWRRIVTLFGNYGVRNVEYVWTLTAEAFAPMSGPAADRWYPGDAYVDHIGADGYNWYGCRTGTLGGSWRSFEQIYGPVRDWAAQHPGKGLFAPEWGSQEDPLQPGRKADWILEAFTTLKQPGWEQWRGMLYFHGEDPEVPNPCSWWVDSSLASLRSFRGVALATMT